MDDPGKPLPELKKVSPSASLLRLDPRFVVNGHDGEGSGMRDPPPHPESTPAKKAATTTHKKGVDVDSKVVIGDIRTWIRTLRVLQEVDPVKQVSSLLYIISLPCEQEPDGAWTFSPLPLSLITRLDKAGTCAFPCRMPQDLRLNESIEPSATPNEKKSSWRSAAFATAKLPRAVRDSTPSVHSSLLPKVSVLAGARRRPRTPVYRCGGHYHPDYYPLSPATIVLHGFQV